MARPLLFLFILLLAAPAALAEPLVIDDELRCVGDELTVHGDVTIRSGGRLYLEDCTFKIDTPPYENGWLNVGIEGSLITVEEGGVLEARSVGRNTTIQPADPAYGYTIDVLGDIILVGTQQHHVEVHGLEGYMAEAFIGGGITVGRTGQATVHNATYHKLFGPALFGTGDAMLDVRNVDVVRASGAFAALDGSTLRIHNVSADMGFEAIRVSKSTLEVTDSNLLAGRTGIHATKSNVTIRDSLVAGGDVGLRLSDSWLEMHASRLQYGKMGILHEHKPERGLETTIHVEDSVIEMLAGTNFPQGMAVASDDADVSLVATRLLNYTGGGISMQNAALLLDRVHFDGGGIVHAQAHEPPSLRVSGVTVGNGTVQRDFVYTRGVLVDVVSDDGPVGNATVRLLDVVAQTDANGTARLVWSLPASTDGVPTMDSVPVTVQGLGRTRTVDVGLASPSLTVNLDEATGGRGIPAPGVAFALLAVAVGFVLRRR